MDLFFDEKQISLRKHIHSWAEKYLFSEMEPQKELEKEALRLVSLLGNEGLFAYAVPAAYGGAREAIQARDLCLIREKLAWGNALADTLFATQALGSYPIALAGSNEQKERYLPPIARGKAIAAFALTEPRAGSDISAIETRARRSGGEYILSGVKSFVSNAGLAHTYVIFARSNAEKGRKGISAFIVEVDRPGLILKEKLSLIFPHPIGIIELEECRVPETQRLGEEGDGLRIALRTLDTLRCTVGAAAVGFGQRALEEALHYSQSRRQFGQTLANFQAMQFKLAEMATELEAARLLVYGAAWANDHGQAELKMRSSMAKLFATEAAQRIVDQALQIHGGMGVVTGSVVEWLYRAVRALRIYEGTSEIQKLVIARELLKKSNMEDGR